MSQQGILWLFPPTDRGYTPPCAPWENRNNMQSHIEETVPSMWTWAYSSMKDYKMHSHIEVFEAVCQFGSLRPPQPRGTTKARNKWDYWAGGGVGVWVGCCFISLAHRCLIQFERQINSLNLVDGGWCARIIMWENNLIDKKRKKIINLRSCCDVRWMFPSRFVHLQTCRQLRLLQVAAYFDAKDSGSFIYNAPFIPIDGRQGLDLFNLNEGEQWHKRRQLWISPLFILVSGTNPGSDCCILLLYSITSILSYYAEFAWHLSHMKVWKHDFADVKMASCVSQRCNSYRIIATLVKQALWRTTICLHTGSLQRKLSASNKSTNEWELKQHIW